MMNSRPLLACLATLVLAGCQRAPVADAELKASRLVDMVKPATVMIISDYTAKVNVPNITIPDDRVAALRQKMVEKLNSGELAQDEKAVTEAAVTEILQNWKDYLVATGTTREIDANMTAVGSGFIVTPDGTIVTNAHVVATEGDELKQGLAENALQVLIDQDVSDLTTSLGGTSDENIALLKKVCTEFYVANMTLGDVELNCHALVANGTPGAKGVPEPLKAKVIREATGTPIPGKDVAILKVAGVNMPTVDLGDDKSLNVGDKLFPLGFPADATFFPEFDKSSVTEPSLTAGLVSAKKQMADGWEVLQTDAAIRGGNSGGPVINSKGQVVGLATFQLIDTHTGISATGANFVVPVTVVHEFLAKAGVTPKESDLTKSYYAALREMDQSHYKLALEQLKEIDKINPGEGFIAKATSECETAIKAGNDRSPALPVGLIIGVGGGLVVVALVFFAIGKMAGKSKATRPYIEQAPQAPQAPAVPVVPAAPPVASAPEAPTPPPVQPPPTTPGFDVPGPEAKE